METFEIATESQTESPFAEPPMPRLSILHLMLWTLCSAVVLSAMLATSAPWGEAPNGYETLLAVSRAIQGVITGAILMGVIVLVSMRVRRGSPMLRQPGHWLLFIPAIVFLIYLPARLSLLLLRNSMFGGMSFAMYLSIIYLFPTIAYVFAARHTHVTRWKLLFGGMAMMAFAQCLYYFFAGGPWYGTLLAICSWGRLLLAGAVLAVSIIDLATGRRYDWPHWTGVATYVTGSSFALLWMIGSRFLR